MARKKILVSDQNPNELVVQADGVSKKIRNFFIDNNSDHFNLGIMPPVVRSVSPLLKGHNGIKSYIVLVERKPEIALIDVYGTKHEIPLPWQHYFIKMTMTNYSKKQFFFESLGIYFSQAKLESLDHTFYSPYLSNVYRHLDKAGYTFDEYAFTLPYQEGSTRFDMMNVCLGRDTNFPADLKNFSELYDKVYEAFWLRGFNNDLYFLPTDFAHKYVGKSISSIEGAFVHISKIPLESILDEDVFKHMTSVF